MLNKWVRGLPTFFKHVTPQILQQGVAPPFCFPPTYAGLPGHRNAVIAAQPHPLRGQPNIRAAAIFYFPQWCDSIRNLQATNPPGTVRMAELFAVESFGECQESEEQPGNVQEANMLVENIKKTHVCDKCGKTGHTASFWINNTKFTCKDNGPGATESDNVDKYKTRYRALAKQASTLQAYNSDLEAKVEALEVSMRSQNRKPYEKHRKNAHVVEEESSDSEESAANEAELSDADSASSAGSFVPSMANAIHNSRTKGKQKRR
jgi:hypothetical protein